MNENRNENKNEKILVNDFVERYLSFSDDELRENYLQTIIKRTYCPVIEKKAVLDLMLKKSINEENIKYIDMFVNHINFIAAIILLYTNITPDKDEQGKSKTYDMYDLLVENGIFNKILKIIGEKEISELTSINNTIIDTWNMQNSSTEAYISNLVKRFGTLFSTITDASAKSLIDILNDSEKMQSVIDVLSKSENNNITSMLDKIKTN